MNKCDKRMRREQIFIVLFLLIFPLIIYGKYIFGDVYYFIMDDSFNQLYPNLYQMAEQIWSGRFSMWNFSIGIGVDYSLYYFDPFNWLAIMGGPEHVALGMVVSQIIKLYVILFCSYIYAQNFCRNKYLCLLFSILVCCSGGTLAKGMYSAYTKITVYLMLLVTLFEYCYKRNKWLSISIPIIFTELSLGYYYLFLMIGILFLYSCGRFFMDEVPIKRAIKVGTKMFAFVLLGTIIVFPILGRSLIQLMMSSRLRTTVAGVTSSSWNLEIVEREVLDSTFLRLLSPDLEGDAISYTGAINYLDGPCFYVGVFSLLIIPQIVTRMKGRKRIICWITLVLSALYIIFPQLTKLSTGNASYTFKMSGILVTFVLLFVVILGINEIVLQNNINKILLVFTYGILQIGMKCYYFKEKPMNTKIMMMISLFLTIYVIMLFAKGTYKRLAVLFVVVTTECVTLTYGNVNNSEVITKKAVETANYNDGTKEVVAHISEEDDSEFYRIEKTYRSVGYADSLVQGYYGTKSYIGGSNVSATYAQFLNTIGMPLSNNDSRWIIGFRGYPQITSLFGVKYMINTLPQYSEYGYKLCGQVGEKYYFENEYALPLGTVYFKNCSYDSFEAVEDHNARRNFLLEYCVSEYGDDVKLDGASGSLGRTLKEYGMDEFSNNRLAIERTDSSETILFEVEIDCLNRSENIDLTAKGEVSTLKEGTIMTVQFIDRKNGTVMSNHIVSVYEGKHKYSLEVSMEGIEQVKVIPSDPELISINDVSVQIYSSDEYYAEYVNQCHDRQRNSMDLTCFSEDEIEGRVVTEENGILVMSFLFDENWVCYIDGNEVPTKRVDYCLLGVDITKGQHDVKFVYKPWRL